ncbi:MAG: aldolase/citrate lyase family protein [Pseudomonadota bacterium]
MDRFHKLLSADRMALSGWSAMNDTFYHITLAKTDFDAITLDMQHGMVTEEGAIRGVAAMLPFGKPIVVRIPVGRFDFVSKILDAGAHGIIAPMINTVEDARALVSFGKYLPTGDRSFGASHAALLNGMTPVDYVKGGNANTKLFAMIETQQAVDNMEAIADVDGIDGLFCGPGDLSISIRNNLQPDPYGPDTIEIIKSLVACAKDRSKLTAAWCGSVDHAKLVAGMGFDFAALGHDSLYLANGVNRMVAEIRG